MEFLTRTNQTQIDQRNTTARLHRCLMVMGSIWKDENGCCYISLFHEAWYASRPENRQNLCKAIEITQGSSTPRNFCSWLADFCSTSTVDLQLFTSRPGQVIASKLRFLGSLAANRNTVCIVLKISGKKMGHIYQRYFSTSVNIL